MTFPGRCVASVRLPNGDIKRCTRYVDHGHVLHLWVETFDTGGRAPVIYEWGGNADVSEPTHSGHVVLDD